MEEALAELRRLAATFAALHGAVWQVAPAGDTSEKWAGAPHIASHWRVLAIRGLQPDFKVDAVHDAFCGTEVCIAEGPEGL